MLRKIFPYDAESSFFNSFKIIFVSEGYLASESALFKASCLSLVDRFLKTSPFNLTRINNNWLSVYSSFVASNNQGAGVDTSSVTDRTAFEAVADTSTGLLSINQEKLNNHFDSDTFRLVEANLNLNDYVGNGVLNTGTHESGYPSGAEFENLPAEKDYHFVAVTKDAEWQQVVIHALCKSFGLVNDFKTKEMNFSALLRKKQKLIIAIE